ncbi:MAG: hypothetical protein R3B83_04060 [Nitrospirales bacterium]|nr:hypothetical protein [Nitrospirales bacterium]
MAVRGLLILLFTFVIPRFIPILHDLQVPLPALTCLIIGVSQWMVDNWWIWVPLVISMPVTWMVARKFLPDTPECADRLLPKIPRVGRPYDHAHIV